MRKRLHTYVATISVQIAIHIDQKATIVTLQSLNFPRPIKIIALLLLILNVPNAQNQRKILVDLSISLTIFVPEFYALGSIALQYMVYFKFRCIRNESWMEELERNCEICGPHRTAVWSCVNSEKTKISYKRQCENPLEAFLDWLFGELSNKFKSLVFAHYGGFTYLNL
jgi:hypothetical protein